MIPKLTHPTWNQAAPPVHLILSSDVDFHKGREDERDFFFPARLASKPKCDCETSDY